MGEPTQHLTGKQEFWGLEFQVTPDVLIPRPETEHLIEVSLDRLAVRELRAGRPPKLTGEGITIVDIGTGSGCIAAALAKELPLAIVYASDISAAALEVARRNAERLGFADRIRFLQSHLFDAFLPLKFDLIVSNPPYIGRREAASLPREVRDHEPDAALYGGEEGYELYGALVAQARSFLKPGGLLVLELGHDSLPAVQPLLESSRGPTSVSPTIWLAFPAFSPPNGCSSPCEVVVLCHAGLCSIPRQAYSRRGARSPAHTRPSCMWTWMPFSFRWSCSPVRNCAASLWSSEAGPINVASSLLLATRPGNTAFTQQCPYAPQADFARKLFFSTAIMKNMENGAIALHRFSPDFHPSSKWFLSTKRIWISLEPSAFMARH